MKKEYVNPQSHIEVAQMPKMMDDFLGIAKVSGGASVAPSETQGA